MLPDFEPNFEPDFERLVATYGRRMYFVARRIVAVHEDANDVVQNTWVKVWQSLDTFRSESELYTWIYRIVVNESLTYLRARRTRWFSESGFSSVEINNLIDNDTYFEADAAERLLAKAVLRLPAKQRAVFTMRYYDEMPYAQMAQVMEVSEGALKASYHVAVKKIEAELNLSLIHSSNE